MRTTIVTKRGLTGLVLALTIAGCSTPLSTRERTTLGGAAIGAGTGAAIGAATGHPGTGAAIGAGAGALGGALIGDEIQRNRRRDYDY